MASWDLEERGLRWRLPQWQSLEEEMGVVLCKRPHRAYLFSWFCTIVPLPGLFGLMSLLLSISFFLLVIKQVFFFFFSSAEYFPFSSSSSSSSLSWLSRGMGGMRDRGVYVPPGRKAHWSSPTLIMYTEHEWKMRGPIGFMLFKDVRRLLHGMVDKGSDVDICIPRRQHSSRHC